MRKLACAQEPPIVFAHVLTASRELAPATIWAGVSMCPSTRFTGITWAGSLQRRLSPEAANAYFDQQAEEVLKREGVPFGRIGIVGGKDLAIEGVMDAKVADLAEAYHHLLLLADPQMTAASAHAGVPRGKRCQS